MSRHNPEKQAWKGRSHKVGGQRIKDLKEAPRPEDQALIDEWIHSSKFPDCPDPCPNQDHYGKDQLFGVWIIDPDWPNETNYWMHDHDTNFYGTCNEEGPCGEDHAFKGSFEEAQRWADRGNTPRANLKGWRLEVRPYQRFRADRRTSSSG